MRPIIAVVGGTVETTVNLSARQRACLVADAVLALVRDHGGLSIVIPDRTAPAEAQRLADLCDGLVLPPGRDLDPARYGASSRVRYDAPAGSGALWHRSEMMRPDPERDALEVALFHAFRARGAPILGLCRGLQVINVALGGTLHQEISSDLSHFVEADGWVPYHPVTLDPGSRVARIVGRTELCLSSLHHQAIDRLGEGLRASGHAADGIVEIIEADPFILGIQAHVEKCRSNFPDLETVFATFVAQAAAFGHPPA